MKINKGHDIYQEIIRQNGLIQNSCNGNHTCGKCKIKVINGTVEASDKEKKILSFDEIKEGVRLACMHPMIESDIEIELPDLALMDVVGSGKKRINSSRKKGLKIAADIGTTTVVVAVIDFESQKIIKEAKFINPQRVYAMDVIGRIQVCNEKSVILLQKMILEKIELEIKEFDGQILEMAICGNSTMEHIFLGISPKSIGEYPYLCTFNKRKYVKSGSLFHLKQSFDILVLDNLSAFVGGDIVAGILGLDLLKKPYSLFIDLGTNGEIAICNDSNLYSTSAAAGPAFEGGNMTCGTGSIPGAIYSITLDMDCVHFKTIQNKKAIGICGTGYIEGISELLEKGLIDETGYMNKSLKINEKITITQNDVRNFQLAKSAIQTAIEIVCLKSDIKINEIQNVYIAGGFSSGLNIEALAQLKIIPSVLLEKTLCVGNSAIQGLIKMMCDDTYYMLDEIVKKNQTIVLSKEPLFNELFLQNMWF